jgi:chromosome segregation ATPase
MQQLFKPLISCLLLAVLTTVHAEEKPGAREREALRRVQSQLQSVQQAQTALQDKLRVSDEDKAALEQRVKGLQSKDREAGQKNKQLQESLDAAQTENKSLQSSKTDLEQRLKAALERLATTDKELAQTSAQLKNVQGVLQSRNQLVSACEKRNSELYGVGRELIAQCKPPEPALVSQLPGYLSGAQIAAFEQRLEDARDKLESARLQKTELAQ